MKILRAALCLAALAWSAAQAQTFNPSASYGKIADTSPQLCVQGGHIFVCATGALVSGAIDSYVFTTNGSVANLSAVPVSSLLGNPSNTIGPVSAITLDSSLVFTGSVLGVSGSLPSIAANSILSNNTGSSAAPIANTALPSGTTTGGWSGTGRTDSGTFTNKTFVAPILGTPISGTLTNTTGYPAASLAAGNLPSASWAMMAIR